MKEYAEKIEETIKFVCGIIQPKILSLWLVFPAFICSCYFYTICHLQHRIAVPTDINTPKVPPPCNMDFPTRPMSSLPLKPALQCLERILLSDMILKFMTISEHFM